jgi:hypothetical protein
MWKRYHDESEIEPLFFTASDCPELTEILDISTQNH